MSVGWFICLMTNVCDGSLESWWKGTLISRRSGLRRFSLCVLARLSNSAISSVHLSGDLFHAETKTAFVNIIASLFARGSFWRLWCRTAGQRIHKIWNFTDNQFWMLPCYLPLSKLNCNSLCLLSSSAWQMQNWIKGYGLFFFLTH